MTFWSRFRREAPNTASSTGSVEDSALLTRLGVDPEALSQLYARYFDRIYRYCYIRLGSHERAEDATSETFMRLIATLDSYRGGMFAAWLFRIAHNFEPRPTKDDEP